MKMNGKLSQAYARQCLTEEKTEKLLSERKRGKKASKRFHTKKAKKKASKASYQILNEANNCKARSIRP
jgi:topoisomerase IA-like protein